MSNLKQQLNSSKLWLKKVFDIETNPNGKMSTRVKTTQQSWHQGEALVLKKGKNQH